MNYNRIYCYAFLLLTGLCTLLTSCSKLQPVGGVTPDQLSAQLINNPEFEKNANGENFLKKAPFRGNYKIRWTIVTGYREFPVVIE